MATQQDCYVPGECVTTVLAMVEEAQTEIERLQRECYEAGGKFPSADHPKAIAFQAVSEALGHIVLDASQVPGGAEHLVVWYPVWKPRRKAHPMARWCRAANLASGLRHAGRLCASAGFEAKFEDYLAGVAYELESLTFPVLYDRVTR
jgi:hypothetical protein